MKYTDEDGETRDYSPNQLAQLPKDKLRKVVESNLEDGDTLEDWQERNMKRAKDALAHQRNNRG